MTPGQAGRRRLNLLVQVADARELLKLDVFLRLAQERLRCDWHRVSRGEAHLVLTADDDPDTIPGLFDDPVAQYQLVDDGPAVADRSSTLVRPLQFEDFIDALTRVEDQLASPPVMLQAPLAGSDAWQRCRFRLKRWPATGVLHDQRYGVRLASFLSKQLLALEDLARLSNVSLEECTSFIDALARLDLLQVQQVAQMPVRPGQRSPAVAPARAASGGLVARLRRRLGIASEGGG